MSDTQGSSANTPAATQTTTPTATSTEAKASPVATSSDEQTIDAAVAEGEISHSQAKDLKKKLKLKVDGKEIEEEIDFNDDETLTRHLQKSKAFDSRLKEHAGFRGQVDDFMKQLQNDPESVLEQLGFNVDDLATKRIQKKVEEMQKSPEQIQHEKLTKELEKLRKEKDDLAKKQADSEMESLRNKHAAEVENSISNALQRSKAKLPQNNPKVYAMIAQNMMMAMENGYPDITADDVIPVVERQWKEELRGYFDSSTEDIMEDIIGKQNLDRLRKKRLAKRPNKGVEAPITVPANKQIMDTGTSKPKEEAAKPKKSYKDFFRN